MPYELAEADNESDRQTDEVDQQSEQEATPNSVLGWVIEQLERSLETLTENPVPDDDRDDFAAKLDRARALFYQIAKAFGPARA